MAAGAGARSASGRSEESKQRGRRKIFMERISLYDTFGMKNPGLYMVLKVQLAFFFFYMLFRDGVRTHRFHVDLSKDQQLLGGLHDWLVFTALEAVLLLLSLFLYVTFQVWQRLRSWLGRVVDVAYLISYLAYVCVSFLLVWYTVQQFQIASVPRLVAFIEQIRLCMKSYSFIRENAYKVLYPWHKDDVSGPAVWYAGQMSPQVGSFSQYTYFLFAPTLLYRDHYPRNSGSIKWNNVFLYTVQFFSIYLVSRVMFLDVLYPVSMRWEDLLLCFLRGLLVSPFMLFLASILVLHAWFNLTAELTRFADREFYQVWWSAVGYSEFYRLWNIPIYDFLYSYILLDLRPWVPYRSLAALPAIILSSVLHDFLCGVSMGFFFPVFIVMFAICGGIVLVSGVKFSSSRTFALTCLGTVLFETFFFLEITARRNCTDYQSGSYQLHALYCVQKHNNLTLW